MKQAAEVLGISSEGVRKRIKRGSLEAEKDPDGKVHVWLDTDRTADGSGDLVEVLRDQVEMLRSELEDWKQVVSTRDEELRRKDHIIAALTDRIPELEAPSEPRDGPEPGSEASGKGEDRTDAPEPTQRRSWLYRFFFGP